MSRPVATNGARSPEQEAPPQASLRARRWRHRPVPGERFQRERLSRIEEYSLQRPPLQEVRAMRHDADGQQRLAVPFRRQLNWIAAGKGQYLPVLAFCQWQRIAATIARVPCIAAVGTNRDDVVQDAQETI